MSGTSASAVDEVVKPDSAGPLKALRRRGAKEISYLLSGGGVDTGVDVTAAGYVDAYTAEGRVISKC